MILKMCTSTLFLVQDLKVCGRCLGNSKDYRSFHGFSPISNDHNLLNFWNFGMIQSSQCHLKGLLHAIFFYQEQNLSGRPCLDAKDYKSFFDSKLRNFSKYKVSFFLLTSRRHNLLSRYPNATLPITLQSS